LIDKFLPKDLGRQTIHDLDSFSRGMKNRTENAGVHYSVAIHPKGVQTDRLFRSWTFYNIDSIPIRSCHAIFSQMRDFQRTFIVAPDTFPSGTAYRPQIIHYPVGGGYFDWHSHPRHPVNYGLIANLSNQPDHTSGNTEIIDDNGNLVKIEDHLHDRALVLFRYDLKHRVAPAKQLTFGTNGKWSAILPIY